MSDIEEMAKFVKKIGMPDDLPEVALKGQSGPDSDALARITARTMQMAGAPVAESASDAAGAGGTAAQSDREAAGSAAKAGAGGTAAQSDREAAGSAAKAGAAGSAARAGAADERGRGDFAPRAGRRGAPPSRLKKVAWWLGTAAVAAGLLAFAVLGRPSRSPAPPIQPASPGPGPAAPGPAAPTPGPQPPVKAAVSAPQTMTALSFIDANTGWVSGYSGDWSQPAAQLIATTDGGKTWSTLAAPAGQVLQLKFIDASHGWAVAQTNLTAKGYQNVAIYATSNGGQSWTNQWEQPAQNLGSLLVAQHTRIAFFGPQNGFVKVGETLLRTRDGGATWAKVALPDGYVADDISFADAQHGWVAAEQGSKAGQMDAKGPFLFATADGGQTWQPSFSAATALGQNAMYWGGTAGLSFADSQNGWLFFKDAGWQSYLYRTTDGGATWQEQSKGVAGGRTVAGAPVFVGSTGWLPVAHGAAPIAGGLWITKDAGANWSLAGGPNRFVSIGGVALVSPTVGWALGIETQGHDFLINTTDGGQTWNQVLPLSGPTTAISLTPGGKGLAIGLPSDPNAVLATADGGQTWTEASRLADQPLAVSADAQGNGWVVSRGKSGESWAILRTADGGHSWSTGAQIPLGGPTQMAPAQPYFRMFDDKNGILQTGDFPATIFMATTDGGITWQQQSSLPRPQGAWTKSGFVSPAIGYLAVQTTGKSATDGLTLMQTADGGKSWSTVKQFGTDSWLEGLAFVSPDQGWLLVRQNPVSQQPAEQLLRTGDGGKSWTAQPFSGAAAQLLRNGSPETTQMFFADNNNGWIVSPQGALRTTDGGKSWTTQP